MGANESKEVQDQISDEGIRAKFQASILWLLTKAQKNVTADQKNLFYEDMEGAWYIKPQLMNRLTSGELYCAACANIFQESPSKWQGHSAVIQTLSRKGIYVVEDDGETTVTETVLMQTAPFRISAHLAMINSIMKAYTSHVVSIEKVVQAVRKFTTVSASSELPYDVEDAMLFWINKSCSTVKRRLEKEHKAKTDAAKKSTSEASGLPSIPLMDDLLKDIGDGSAMATLISFYCPNCLKLDDICLKPYLAIADSLYNIQLVKKFCDSNLPRPVFHFSYNDMMYTSEILKTNLVAFFAEMFYMFEVNKVDCVTGPVMKTATAESPAVVDEAARPTTAKKTAIPPISDVTKRSFQRPAELGKGTSDPELSKLNANLPTRQQLLPKRQQASSDGDEPSQKLSAGAQQSRAWEERRSPEKPTAADIKHRTYSKAQLRKIAAESGIADSTCSTETRSSEGSLLTNVSLDSDLMESATFSFSDTDTPRDTARSTAPANVTDPSHPDYMELQSVTSLVGTARSDTSQRPTGFTEPLMPALLKPAKEKNNSHPKDVESGEAVKRSPGSPTKPVGKVNGSPKHVAPQVDSDSSSDEEFMTPQASQPNTPFGGSPERNTNSLPAKVSPKKSSPQKVVPPSKPVTVAPPVAPPQETETQQNAAFFIDTENGVERPIKSKEPPVEACPFNSRRGAPVSQSFVRTDRPLTANLARKVGIPVIGDSESQAGRLFESVPRRDSEGHSSSDFSDHESSKIHRDHKLKESNDMEGSFYLPPRTDSSADTTRPDSLFGKDKETEQKALSEVQVNDTKPSPTTSFAELKKQRSGVTETPPEVAVYHSETVEAPSMISLKSQFQRSKEEQTSKPVKKTTFAALPNQTTWQESAQKSAQKMKDMNKENEAEAVQPLASEISSIRLKLEAKRRNIELEKKKIEVQWTKQRQRLGKAAFLHVVAKGKGDKIDSIEEEKEEGKSREVSVERKASHRERLPSDDKKFEEIPRREEVQRREEPRHDALSKRRDSEPVRQRTPPPQSRPRSATPPRSETPPRSRTPVQVRTEPAGEEKVRRDSNRSTPPPPPPPSTQAGDMKAEKDGKKYSTEEIKSTIDNVRQKWFVDQSPVHAQKDSGDAKPFQPPNEENANDYGNSLEKLNMSLNDLQGEIMKLTLQQEQITKTITTATPKTSADPQPTTTPVVTMSTSAPTTQTPAPHVPPLSQSHDPYYSQHGKPPIPGDPYGNYPHQNPYMMQPQGPYGSQEFQRYGMPPYPLNASQQGYMQGYPHGVPPHGASPLQQFQQQQMYQHLYGQHPGARQPFPGQTPYSTQSTPPQSYLHNVSAASTQYGVSNYQPYSSTLTTNSNINLPLTQPGQPLSHTGASPSHHHTTTSTAYQRSSPQSPVSASQSKSSPSHYETEPVSDYSRATDGYSSMTSSHMSVSGTGSFHSTGSDPASTAYLPSPTTSLPKPSPVQSPVNTTKQPPSSDYNTNYQEYKANMDRNYKVQSPVSDRSPVHEPEPEPSPEVELPADMNVEEDGSGFYISFGDSVTPKKPKPKFLQKRRKEEEVQEEVAVTKPAPPPVRQPVPQPVVCETSPPQEKHSARHQEIQNASYTVPVDIPQQSPKPDIELQESVRPSPPGVGFVIGQDEKTLKEAEELAIQKRKEKVMQLQMKRRQEAEKKAAKLEQANAKKREEQRLKEEQAEAKKAEEKAKREQIFQAYLARKAAEEEEERGGPPAREPPKPKARKPGKSRPGPAAVKATAAALGGGDDKKSISSASLSSQEEFHARSESPPAQPPGQGSSPAVIHSLYTKDDASSSSGSVTHRRGDSPGGSGSRLYRSQSAFVLSKAKHRGSMSRLENRKGFSRMNHSDHSDTGSNPDYVGPKLYVKPKSMSNRNVIQNAIAYCCLAGTVNHGLKNKTLEEMDVCEANHFLILFRDAGCKYRALYQYNPDTEEVLKVSGTGPKQVTPKMLDRFYKYNSGQKSFSQINTTKHLSVSIDAITIQSSLWQSKKPSGPVSVAAKRPPPR
ncbi:calmodulin-regulated spectrin-associated protein 1-B-like isoform X3 [Lineus longissimus]|uniref:calmodulin-regulated spectrin-associated protein 1-B-like isoform X3 n=1 Tax=Lineus longissimus TaxID=88925 RepID=UPI00315C6C1A